jgi:sugar phosphate isomerase/epimerase
VSGVEVRRPVDAESGQEAGSVEIGVFARVFPPGPAEQVAGAIRAAGFRVTQLNLSALGRPTLDLALTAAEAGSIASAFSVAGVRIWGISGTFNAIHPDPRVRAAGIAGCLAVIARAPQLGAEVVTLCSGTLDPDDMWRAHPDNSTAVAWRELRATLDELIPAAAAAGVRLGIEPEPGNVVVDAAHADRLLTELGADADRLAVVLDPANLLTPATLDRQEAVLRAAFDRLGPWVAAVHAKDVPSPDAGPDSVAPGLCAAGLGAMDYDLVLELRAGLPRPVPLIAQDLTPEDARRVHDFLAAGASRARTAERAR